MTRAGRVRAEVKEIACKDTFFVLNKKQGCLKANQRKRTGEAEGSGKAWAAAVGAREAAPDG